MRFSLALQTRWVRRDSDHRSATMRSALGSLLILFGLLFSPGNADAEADDSPVNKRFGKGFVDRFIPIDGGRLCCVQRVGSGPTLMLIPGTFSDSGTFRDLVRHLDKSLNLLLVENRGLGRSWPRAENGSIEQCAQDALLVAREMGASDFYIGGHSLGGMISIEVAGIAPEKLRGVVSIEGWTNWRAARDAFGNDMKSTLTDEQLKEVAAYRAEMLRNWSKTQVKEFGSIWKKWDGLHVLRTTNLPVLELYGDRNRAKPTRAQLHIPKRDLITLHWIAGASHKIHYERPRQVAQVINRFIRRCETDRARRLRDAK
jgi:pimeloyl-ACP methyl ester carboxylesterase